MVRIITPLRLFTYKVIDVHSFGSESDICVCPEVFSFSCRCILQNIVEVIEWVKIFFQLSNSDRTLLIGVFFIIVDCLVSQNVII